MLNVLKLRGFAAYLMIVFLNAFIDFGHKILIQNTLYQTTTFSPSSLLALLINALILLPSIFLLAPSGFLADRFPKKRVMQFTAASTIVITLAITACYYYGQFWLALLATLLLGIQNAIHSPAMYGYLKEIFGKEHLAQTNALTQSIIITAIITAALIFTSLFSHYAHLPNTMITNRSSLLIAFAPVGFLLVICAISEILFTTLIPNRIAADPSSSYKLQPKQQGQYYLDFLNVVYQHKIIFVCVLGLAVYWSINQVLLASYGIYVAQHVPHASSIFTNGSLAVGGIGILLGTLYAGKLSRGFIETGIIPVATIGITLSLLFMPNIHNRFLILGLFLAYGFCGGMLITPLNALIQFNAEKHQLGKVLATNNFIQNAMVLIFLGIETLISKIGAGSIITLRTLMLIAFGSTIFAFTRLPQSLSRFIIYFFISKFYRVDVYGLENLPSSSGVLLLGNHTSYLDWAILQAASPRPIRFVMDRGIYMKWYLKWLLKAVHVIPISRHGSKQSLQAVRDALNNNEVVVMFPEGYLSRNGQLGKFHSGYLHAIEGTHAKIIPFYHRGLWGTFTSLATAHYKIVSRARMRTITVAFGKPLAQNTQPDEVKRAVFELSIQTWKHYTASLGSIADEWLARAKELGNEFCVADSMGVELSHHKLLAAVFFMAGKWDPLLLQQQNIGIIMPPSVGGVIANLTCLVLGKTIVNLNYTAGQSNLAYALEQANIKTVITSQIFMKKLITKGIDLSTTLNKTQIIHLENYKQKISQLRIFLNYLFIKTVPLPILKALYIRHQDNNQVAAILFSSGSEGQPKGIELTHGNILGNAKQITSIVNLQDADVIMSTLPLFHAFGLTATTIMPLIQGTPFICHADPTDAVKIGQLIYHYQATIMCGTSTIFGLYCRNPKLHPLMLQSLRLVIAGAEKLSPKVKQAFKQKFDITLYEGYGTTEVAPVASTNVPDILNPDDWHVHIGQKAGTVGLPLPGAAFRIVDPHTLRELPTGKEGLILIGGTQVMRGYLNDPQKTLSVLIQDGDITWYKTGDKGYLDEDGFLVVIDRYSRFVKIGGEMLSLSAIEQRISYVLPDDTTIVAVALPDERKGEKIALLFSSTLTEIELQQKLKEADLENNMHPSLLIKLNELPRLGNGKTDFTRAKHLATEWDIKATSCLK